MRNDGSLVGFRIATAHILVAVILIALYCNPALASSKKRHQFQSDRCDPELGIRPREATVTHGSEHLRLSLPIRISCEELRRNPDLLKLQVIQPGKDPISVTYEYQPPLTGLSVLFLPDIASEYLVARGDWFSSARYLEVIFGSLLDLFNFAGQSVTDQGVVAVPGEGFVIEKPVRDGNLLYNELMEGLPQLASFRSPSQEGLSSFDLLQTWMERPGGSTLPRVVMVIRWRPEPFYREAYPLDVANRQGVEMIIIDIVSMDRLDASGTEPTGMRKTLLLAPEWPADPLVFDKYLPNYNNHVTDRISELEDHITDLRPSCILSFTSSVVVDSSQLNGNRTEGVYAKVLLSEIGGGQYECAVPWRFSVDDSSDGKLLVFAIAVLASLALGAFTFSAAASITTFYPALKELLPDEGKDH